MSSNPSTTLKKKKRWEVLDIVAYASNPALRRKRQENSLPGQPEVHSKTLSQKQQLGM
jgi:hypothetical protein